MIAQGRFAFAANGSDVTLINIETAKVFGKISHENEDVVSFAVSPNSKLLGATFKNHMVRIYNLGELHEDDWKPESVIHSFKTGNMLGLECCFDPSSRYLAIATSDSQVKVFDAVKGFQTHNFVGHQNIVLVMQFFPAKDSLRLITAGEDLVVKVWDLVINKEVASIRGCMGRITSLVITKDHKTLIVGSKDGKIAFYNVSDNYRQIAVFEAKSMGIPPGDVDLEVNALSLLNL
jgi:WD40 repeat protein